MRDFERYGPAIALFHFGCLAMAVYFGVVVLRGGSPVTLELYGPRVYAIPALAWASVQIAGSALGGAGAVMGGKTGAVLCLLGSSLSALMYCTMAALALEAVQGTLVAAGSMFLTAPLSVAAAFTAGRYLTRGAAWEKTT